MVVVWTKSMELLEDAGGLRLKRYTSLHLFVLKYFSLKRSGKTQARRG
jgi:hypothetical protein